MKTEFLKQLTETAVSRRDFAKKLGIGGAGVAGATMLSGIITPRAFADDGDSDGDDQPASSDIDILNFALNLEYLEAEFYTIASFGVTLEASGLIPGLKTSGETRGKAQSVPNFASSDVAYLASALQRDEVQHVLFLLKALGSAAVPKPTIDLTSLSFALESDQGFIIAAASLEPVGTSAYAGAAPLIQNKSVLDAAARIGLTEAQHAGAMRTEVVRRGFKVPASDKKDVLPGPDSPFFVDPMGLTVPRTAQEIIAIVKSLFPDGLNGNIK
jgi:ferritin-like protein